MQQGVRLTANSTVPVSYGLRKGLYSFLLLEERLKNANVFDQLADSKNQWRKRDYSAQRKHI